MTKYVAFLRAINVGGRFIKMEDLRTAIAELAVTHVATYIQSGNVIFESSRSAEDLEVAIENKLQEYFELEVPTFVRDGSQLRTLVDLEPFSDRKPSDTVYISFTKSAFDQQTAQQVKELSSEIDRFEVYDNHIYWLYHRDKGKTKMTNNKLERKIKQSATRRNMNTIHKLIAKFFSE